MRTRGMNSLRRRDSRGSTASGFSETMSATTFRISWDSCGSFTKRRAGLRKEDIAAAAATSGDDAAARRRYLDYVIRQHRKIRFAGMEEVDSRVDVEAGLGAAGLERTEIPRCLPFAGREERAARVVILGGPGSGKTTLLEAFSLALAGGASFPWSGGLPELLPVFYRIRELDKDRESQADIWECVRQQCSRSMGENLPAGFVQQQMRGRVIVFLDGLDEARSVSRRHHIVEAIDSFAERLSDGSRVIVTSRPQVRARNREHHPVARRPGRSISSAVSHPLISGFWQAKPIWLTT